MVACRVLESGAPLPRRLHDSLHGLQVQKEALSKEYANVRYQQPYHTAMYEAAIVLEARRWHTKEYEAVIGGLQPADLRVHSLALLLHRLPGSCLACSESQALPAIVERTCMILWVARTWCLKLLQQWWQVISQLCLHARCLTWLSFAGIRRPLDLSQLCGRLRDRQLQLAASQRPRQRCRDPSFGACKPFLDHLIATPRITQKK